MPQLALLGSVVNAQALVFDKDGVLVDFERYWGALVKARVACLVEGPRGDLLAEPQARDELMALLGCPAGRIDPDGPLATGTRAESMAAAAGFLYRRGLAWSDARDRAREAFVVAEDQVPPGALAERPGAGSTLEALKSQGWRIGVATTDTAAHAWFTLERLGIAPLVEALVGGDEVALSKPHPQMLERVCCKLGVPIAETIVVGDGVNDLVMARRAGARATIGVLGGMSSAERLAPHADLVLPDITHLLAIGMAQ